MRKIFSLVLVLFFAGMMSADAAFWNKSKNRPAQQSEQTQPQTAPAVQNSNEASYPQDVDGTPISEDEYVDEDIDIEQMYRDMPVPEFRYVHNIDPGEYQDTRNTTWSPYPLFRLTSPLFFKSVAIQPGYYLLTPREHEGAWYMLFKEAGRIKYIVPCYKREMVPYNFYKNNLPQIKLTTAQKIREKTLLAVGKLFPSSSKREPLPDTFLEAEDLDNNFISVIVYWGDYRYYMVLRSIQL